MQIRHERRRGHHAGNRPLRLILGGLLPLALLASTLATLPPPASAATPPAGAAGALDTSFGSQGVATATIPGLNLAAVTQVLIQADGKILVAGLQAGTAGSVVVARFTATGGLDTAGFGGGKGYVRLALGSTSASDGAAIALQPNGQILVGGSVQSGTAALAAMTRLNPDGSTDTSFGTKGTVATLVRGSPLVHVTGIVVLSSGLIVASAWAGSSGNFTLLRYTSSGALDTSFGTKGIGQITTAVGPVEANGVAVTADGHLIEIGFAKVSGQNDTAVARFNANGTADTTWPSSGTKNGTTTFDLGAGVSDQANGVAIDPTGAIDISGTISTSPSMAYGARLTSGGSIDTGFGTNGVTAGTFDGAVGTGGGATLDGSGRLLVAGGTAAAGATTSALGVERLTSSGAYDSAFGVQSGTGSGNGLGRESVACPTPAGGTANGAGTAAAVQPNGQIVLAGWCNGSLEAARLNAGNLSNLTMTTTTPTVPAGHGVIPLSSIPPGLLNTTVASLASSKLYGSNVFGSPLIQLPLIQLPLIQLPLIQLPLIQLPLIQLPIPLSSIPLTPTAQVSSWAQVLAGTPYAGLALQSVTLQEVLALCRPASLASCTPAIQSLNADQINLNATPLRNVSLAAFLLGSTPVSALPPGPGCGPCGTAGSTQSAVDLELAGANLQAYWTSTTIDVAALYQQHVLVNSPLANVPLPDMGLARTSLGTVVTASLPNASDIVTCSDPSAGNCSTLAVAQANGFIKQSAVLGQLVGDGVVGTVPLASLVVGIIPSDALPIEQIQPFDAVESLPSTPAPANPAQYEIDFDLGCAGAAGLTIKPALPAGFTTIAGSTRMTVGGTTTPVTVANDGSIQPSSPVRCSGSQHVTVTLAAEPSSSLGTRQTSGVAVSTVSDALSITGQAPVSVVNDFQPNSPTSPYPISPDTLYLGHIDTPGHVDYFSLTPPAPGSEVIVSLSHLPADYDLVLYGSGAPQLRAAPLIQLPLIQLPLIQLPLIQLASTDPSGATQPEVLNDVPILPTQPGRVLRGYSTQRGTSTEAVTTVVSDSDTSPFLIQVSGYNGASSALPYTLRVSVIPPPPAPVCQARNYSQTTNGGTAGTFPTTPLPANTQTLILVNQKRMGDIYGGSATASMMTELNKLAARPDVRGVVVPVESDPNTAAVTSDYQAWDQNPCSPTLANQVVTDINTVVDHVRTNLLDLRYVVIVGNDEAIPEARIPDLTPQFNERGAADSETVGGLDNATSAAARNGDVLSDDPYGTFTPTPTLGGNLYLPQVALGRMVETPADIQAAADAYISANGVRAPNASFVTGYDGFSPVATDVNSTVSPRVSANQSTSQINDTWTASQAETGVNGVAGNGGGFISVNGHADPSRLLSAGGFNAGNYGDLVTTSNLPANLSGSILFTIGCHAGLNLSDTFVASPAAATFQSGQQLADWPQSSANHNAAGYQASTGYGLGDTDVIAYTERVMDYFAKNLDGSMTVGQALTYAKQQYARLGASSVYDLKAIEESAFYGLPMYRLSIHGGVGGSLQSVVPPETAGPAPTAPVFSSSGLQTYDFSGLTQVTSADGRGTYYVVPGQQPEVVPNDPIEPRAEEPVVPPAGTTGLVIHGFLIDGLSSYSTSIDPVYDTPVADNSGFSPEPSVPSADFPSQLQTVQTTVAPSGAQNTVTLVPGQFASDGSGTGTGVQTNFTAVQGESLFSNSTNLAAPSISSVQGYLSGTTATFVVNTPNTDVVRGVVLVAPSTPSTSPTQPKAWQHVELANLGNGEWAGTMTVPSGSSGIGPFFVQLANNSGLVAVSSNKGRNFSATSSAPPPLPTTNLPAVTIVTPAANATYAKGASIPSAFYCTDLVSTSCTGPNSVDTSTGGSHTFQVTASDGTRTTTSTVSYQVDATVPAVNLTASYPQTGPGGSASPVADANPTSVTFAITPADGDDAASSLSLRCSLDGTVPVPCTSPVSVAGLSAGQHTFAAEAIDPAGNLGSASVTIDTTQLNADPLIINTSHPIPTPTAHLASTSDGSTFTPLANQSVSFYYNSPTGPQLICTATASTSGMSPPGTYTCSGSATQDAALLTAQQYFAVFGGTSTAAPNAVSYAGTTSSPAQVTQL